jgi:prenyltransferase beta subunit
MLAAARSARNLLRDAGPSVEQFLAARLSPAGAFKGRSDAPDLYYTVFGAESLLALSRCLPEGLPAYLRSFGSGESLDFVHLGCLARLWADSPGEGLSPEGRAAVLAHLATFRSADGGFSHVAAGKRATAYGCFLAACAHEDIEAELPDRERFLAAVESLRTPDGGYANEPERPTGLVTATAAAVTVLAHFGRSASAGAAEWLLARRHPRGGFVAFRGSPMPDLLSTATALHSLAAIGVSLREVRQPCLEFLDTVWSSDEGGFRAHWLDDAVDCEYTWYGLLALGHLAE